jgi:adenylyl cyclase-associated protein
MLCEHGSRHPRCWPAGAKSGSAATSETKTKAVAAKAPRLECEQGRKWLVEHQVDNAGIVITDTNPRQAIYIFGCRNSTIQASSLGPGP